MWLWWIISLVILMAAVAFSLYIFYSGYQAPLKKDFPLKRNINVHKPTLPLTRQQVINALKLKLQAVENNSMLYYNELKKLQQRIQTLEKNKNSGNPKKAISDYDENWEELYYEATDVKQKLENELDLANQKLQEAEELVSELMKKEKLWKEKRSELENELNKAHTLQNKIGELQQQLEGAAQREKELELLLLAEKEVHKDFETLQQQYAFIQSEADELRNRIKEINNRDVLLQQKINRLTQLESDIEISEYEKMDIRKSIEEIIIENEALALKLQELQEKLNTEKYA